MSNLSFFLKQNVEQEENVKYVASKRYKDEEGKPVEWELRSLTTEEYEAFNKQCIKRVPVVGGYKGQYTKDLNTEKLTSLMVVACVVEPNLNSKELQDSYGVMGAEALVKKLLKPGEYQNLSQKIQEISGFDILQEELEEEAKN